MDALVVEELLHLLGHLHVLGDVQTPGNRFFYFSISLLPNTSEPAWQQVQRIVAELFVFGLSTLRVYQKAQVDTVGMSSFRVKEFGNFCTFIIFPQFVYNSL